MDENGGQGRSGLGQQASGLARKVTGESKRLIRRAAAGYQEWSSSDSVVAVAPDDFLLAPVGPGDDAALAVLQDHDPLSRGASELAVAGLAIDPDAIVLGELIIAASIATQNRELAGDRYDRMMRFVLGRSEDVTNAVGVAEPFGVESVLRSLCADWTEAQRLLLLIEAAASNPFDPHSIAWDPAHEAAALAHVATVIGLPASAAGDVASTFAEAAKAHNKISLTRAGMYGLGVAAAIGGAGFLAAPALGAALGSAAGLSGAAATSHGLALLGSVGGATAPGTLTAGGMWLVAQTGAAAGAVAGTGGSLLFDMGASQSQNEIIKLQVTYKMILLDLQRNDAEALDVLSNIEERVLALEERLAAELQVSDPDSPRVENLESTLGALQAADMWMDGQLDRADDGTVMVHVSDVAKRVARLEGAMSKRRRGAALSDDNMLALLPAEGRSLVEDRMQCRFAVHSELDRWDVIAAIGAGIAGAAIDAVIVGDPSNPLTAGLRENASVRGGNWLESLAKVPYDPSIGPGMTPNTHRVLTPGHDPLLGLVIGTRDILQSTMTRSSVAGAVQFVDRPTVDGSTDVFSALATQVMHLLSDVVTPAGLPLPGWTALTTAPSLAGTAVHMYAKGYDTWHLAPMAVPVAAIHAVGSAYWAARANDGEPVSDDRRNAFTVLALGVASAGDLATMLATGGNPLALNYAMWLELARQTAKQIRRRSQRSALVTIDDATANQQVLNHGWAALVG